MFRGGQKAAWVKCIKALTSGPALVGAHFDYGVGVHETPEATDGGNLRISSGYACMVSGHNSQTSRLFQEFY